MRTDRAAGWLLRFSVVTGLLFLHVPMLFIVLYAFSGNEKTFEFPPQELTTRWFFAAFERQDIWPPLWLSIQAAAVATGIALVLGTMAAAAVHRARFFGREFVSLLLLLPIALPGIITGVALRSALLASDVTPGLFSVVLGHATFCLVLVYNNVLARFRRFTWSQVEAAMDLGADVFQTFRLVVAPHLATAWLAGGLLAFALSFDEIIVTTFTAGQQQTLPIWMFSELTRPRQRPVTNVVAVLATVVTLVPVLLAHRLTRGTDDVTRTGR